METETAAALSNGPKMPTGSMLFIYIYAYITLLSLKGKGDCSAQNIPEWDMRYISDHSIVNQGFGEKKQKHLLIQIKNRSFGVKRPGFKSLSFYYLLAVQSWQR